MRLVVGVCLLVAGCDRVFDLNRPPPKIDAAVDADPDAIRVDAPDAAIDGPIDAAIDAPMIDAPASCPSTYTLTFNAHLYRFVVAGAKQTWQAAAIDCANDELGHPSFRTHLIVLNSDQERSQVAAWFTTPVWIGFSDLLTEGFFRHNTTENTLGYPAQTGQQWTAGGPGSDGDCVIELGNADLDDRDCAVPEYFGCECDAFANTPAQYTP